jgi:hypothetical protein
MEEVQSADQSGNDSVDSSATQPPSSQVDESDPNAQGREDTTGGTSSPSPKNATGIAESKTGKDTAGQTETDPSKVIDGNLFKGGPKTFPASEKNILHNYRSWTYNWTLGAITPSAMADNKFLERDINTYTILNSTGKGTRGIGISGEGFNSSGTNFSDNLDLISSFNSESAGRFDMFIDNISVDSIIGAGSKGSGASIATTIGFDVFEPYSMNGLIEAMQVAARAAGYSDYMKSVFALRVQFQGWPDGAGASHPEVIPMSTRYFPITITEIQVDVNESGTKYKVNSVPVPQMGLGAPNALTADIKVAGDTVGEILLNFFEAINQMVQDRTKQQTDQAGRDKYEISCPKLVVVGEKQNTKAAILSKTTSTGFTSEIIKAKMNDELTSVNVFKMGDPAQFKNGYVAASVPGSTATNATSNPSTGKLTPKGGTVVFASGSQIHDCIAAIVRDSEYTRDLLQPENLDKVKKGDGLVTYFTVRMEADINSFDRVNNKNFQTFRYVLEPYTMHYTRIPGQEQGKVDLKSLKQKIKREYNYIYTGKNEDITKFSLKFDNLYFTSLPAMLGNRPAVNQTALAAGRDNVVEANQQGSTAVEGKPGENKMAQAGASSAPMASTRQEANANDTNQEAKAGQPQATPYAKLAENLHNAVLNNVDMIQGTLEILGDPYYLVTGGMGNTDLDLKEQMLTADGQAPTTQGDLFIHLNFKNPIDINSKTGLIDFGVAPLSFSGVYRVITLKNNFKDGMFTQAIDIIRVPGQILGKETEQLPANFKNTPLPGQQVVKDTAPADILKSGFRPSDFNLANLVSRGLPSTGLPGSLSNFTNSALGSTTLGKITGSVSSLLSQVAGAAGVANQITSQLGISPVSGINALTSGIRLASTNLNSLGTAALSVSNLGALGSAVNIPAASLATAGAAIGSVAGIANAATKLASNVSSSISDLSSVNVASVSGKASSLVDSASALATDVTKLAGKGADAISGTLGNVKNSIASLQNAQVSDIAGLSAKLGIDASAFAGLSPDRVSKMTTELKSLADSLPADADIASLKEQGLSFANLTKAQLANLPATQPKITAPSAAEDPAFAAVLEQKYGSVKTLLGGKANLNPLTDINKVTNPMGITSAATSFAKDSAEYFQDLLGNVSNANSLVNNTIGSAVGIANNVGSLAQNTVQGFAPASIGLGSIESNLTNVANLAQSQISSFNNLGISVTSQFGSKLSSPLAKLVKDSNIIGSASA